MELGQCCKDLIDCVRKSLESKGPLMKLRTCVPLYERVVLAELAQATHKIQTAAAEANARKSQTSQTKIGAGSSSENAELADV